MSISSQYSPTNREQQVRSGRYWVSMAFFDVSNPVPPSVANRLNHVFDNPAGSGTNAFLTKVLVDSNIGTNYPPIYRNPTGNLPTTPWPGFNANLSNTSAPACSVKADISAQVSQSAGAFTGGTLIGYSSGPGALLGGSITTDLSPFLVPPGTSFGITTKFLNAVIIRIAFEWFEEQITF